VISSRKAPDLEKAQAHLAGRGIEAEWIAADNSRDEDVKRLADEAIEKLGRLDILVNNAGATSERGLQPGQETLSKVMRIGRAKEDCTWNEIQTGKLW
jgi:NAD(P)-dependent dehydrogenase (short-subunit alcohol dehydrogenase family)